MENPYNGRFVAAFAYLKDRGKVKSQNKFCQALELPTSHMSGIRAGQRKVGLQTVTKLYTVFGVSITYMVLGQGPIMAQEKEEPTPEEKTALEIELARAKQALSIYEKVIQAKDEEIRYLRELLKIELEDRDSSDDSPGSSNN